MPSSVTSPLDRPQRPESATADPRRPAAGRAPQADGAWQRPVDPVPRSGRGNAVHTRPSGYEPVHPLRGRRREAGRSGTGEVRHAPRASRCWSPDCCCPAARRPWTVRPAVRRRMGHVQLAGFDAPATESAPGSGGGLDPRTTSAPAAAGPTTLIRPGPTRPEPSDRADPTGDAPTGADPVTPRLPLRSPTSSPGRLPRSRRRPRLPADDHRRVRLHPGSAQRLLRHHGVQRRRLPDRRRRHRRHLRQGRRTRTPRSAPRPAPPRRSPRAAVRPS